jgi:hypothetical protein
MIVLKAVKIKHMGETTMKRFVVSMFLVLLVLVVVLGCGQHKNNADAAEINTAPLNYLAIRGVDTSFYQNLSFEDKVRVMTRKKYVFIGNSPTETKEGVRFENDKVIVNTRGMTLMFSNSSGEKFIATSE